MTAALAGCAPDMVYDPPRFPFQASYAGRIAGAPVLLDNLAWWRGLGEPVLDQLIAGALTDSLSLELARERVVEARASLATVPGAVVLAPEVRLNRRSEAGQPAETLGQATLGLTWMLDPWGARRQEIKAARGRIETADAELDAARLLVIYNVANAYVDLRYRQRLLQVRQQELRSRRQTLGLTRRLLEQNSATRLDLLGAQARMAETEATLPGIAAAIAGQKLAIAVLLGRTPGTLEIDLDRNARQPLPKLSATVGIPADLLRNRPDLRIAERLYYAAVAETGRAEADLYPKLSLAGTITLNTVAGATSTEYFFGPTLQLPALPGSSRRAAVEVRRSQARQAHTSWVSAVLDAILDVETALASYSAAAIAVGASQRSVRLYREAADLTRDLLQRDAVTLRDLVEAEESVSDAELMMADNIFALARAFVDLNINLGSGNSYGEVVATAPVPGG